MKILIADDNELNLALFVRLVKAKFHDVRVIEAVNGYQAVSLAKEHAPHLILMDIEMPAMNGFEALKMLKSEPHTSCIPIVAVTGYSIGTGDENREMLLNKGFDGYISKPFDVNEFLDEIIRHISD